MNQSFDMESSVGSSCQVSNGDVEVGAMDQPHTTVRRKGYVDIAKSRLKTQACAIIEVDGPREPKVEDWPKYRQVACL